MTLLSQWSLEFKNHYLEMDADKWVRYLNYDVKSLVPRIRDVKAKTEFAALYFGVRF